MATSRGPFAKRQKELARREKPDSLVPIDRDPVPQKFTDLVKRYYEKLGTDPQ